MLKYCLFSLKKKLNDTLFHFDVVMTTIIDQRTIPSGQEKIILKT